MKQYFLILLVIASVVQPAASLDFDLISNMPPTITNVNLSHYDLGATGKGPTMFLITLRGDAEEHKDLIFYYQVYVQGEILAGGMQKVYEGCTNYFDLRPNEMVSVRSNEFIQRNVADPSVRFNQTERLYRIYNDELQEQILNSGKAPTGYVRCVLILKKKKNDELIAEKSITHSILNVSRLAPVTPGTEVTGSNEESVPESYNPFPTFRWISDLNNPDIYSGDDVFEFKLFKKDRGRSLNETMAMKPIFTQRTKVGQVEYPMSAVELEDDVIYYWQVTAFLKGIIDSRMTSPIFGFRFKNATPTFIEDPDVKKISNDLKIMLGTSSYSALLSDYEKKYTSVTLKIDGKPVEISELSDLSRDIMTGKSTILGVTQESKP